VRDGRSPRKPDLGGFRLKVAGEPRAEVVPPGIPRPPGVLHYRVLATGDWGTWLEIGLETPERTRSACRRLPAVIRLLGDAQ